MRRTKQNRTVLHWLGDLGIVGFAMVCTFLATEAMQDYSERMADAQRLERVHKAGMAIGAAMCVREPQP